MALRCTVLLTETGLAAGLALVPLVISGDIPGHQIEHPMAIVLLGGSDHLDGAQPVHRALSILTLREKEGPAFPRWCRVVWCRPPDGEESLWLASPGGQVKPNATEILRLRLNEHLLKEGLDLLRLCYSQQQGMHVLIRSGEVLSHFGMCLHPC